MAEDDPKVKQVEDPTTGRRFFVLVWVQRCQSWIDNHPRIGWYIAVIATLNTVLGILNLLHG